MKRFRFHAVGCRVKIRNYYDVPDLETSNYRKYRTVRYSIYWADLNLVFKYLEAFGRPMKIGKGELIFHL